MGDRDLLAASAREMAAPEHSYLVDGVLSAPLLAAAWGPIVSGDARLTLVLYEMMRKLDLSCRWTWSWRAAMRRCVRSRRARSCRRCSWRRSHRVPRAVARRRRRGTARLPG